MVSVASLLMPVQASDRPYLATTSAAAEEDDDNVWAVETTLIAARKSSDIRFTAEYAFNPTTSVQFEANQARAKGSAAVRGAELEFKHLFNHIARDGWGWGINANVSFDQASGPWRRTAQSVTLPYSLRLADSATAGTLHLNLGISKPVAATRRFSAALALEREVWRRTTLFAETARDAEGTLAQIGLRHWVQRDRFSADLAWLTRRADGTRSAALVFGLGWYDL